MLEKMFQPLFNLKLIFLKKFSKKTSKLIKIDQFPNLKDYDKDDKHIFLALFRLQNEIVVLLNFLKFWWKLLLMMMKMLYHRLLLQLFYFQVFLQLFYPVKIEKIIFLSRN